ncbi:hypothetical protein [Rhizobium leguminosarum]|uniref:hypothetical protein n=1 Tax=Rhizobium leguminosarum TaxID=384 RepID=UPI0014410412|nr:hypothetical protein [Rhizobium leguminosarum]MBY5863339.1 hypothetical protein [Rhizobium leguminosarum]NKM04218.1 hypothetical protein [Rhizobium leguminosarum bv. viciae]
MFPRLRKLTIGFVTAAIGVTIPLTFSEANSAQGEPENLGSSIFVTGDVKPEFLYCFIDMSFFSYAESDNCKKSRYGLGLIVREAKWEGINIQDDATFTRVIAKIFSIYYERLNRGNR